MLPSEPRASASSEPLVLLPDLLAFPRVVQGKEYVGVFPNGVVGETLQAEEEVMGHWHPAGFPVTWAHCVYLTRKANPALCD